MYKAYRPAWKDFHIEKLRGNLIPNPDPEANKAYSAPTLAQYNKWMVGIKKTLGACKIAWLLPMALSLPYKDGNFTHILHMVDP